VFADDNSYAVSELPRCACGALVRPNICWFGEQPYQMDRIYHALEECDTFIAIGTSGSVQPVASFVTMLKQRPHSARTIFWGVTDPANAVYFDEVHLGSAAELVPKLLPSWMKTI
jgi:NAD-dependent protein deacetylase/lipoamidase